MRKLYILILIIIMGFIFIPNCVFAATLDKTSIESTLKAMQEKDSDIVYKVNDDNFIITNDGVNYIVNFTINSSTATSDPNTSIFTMSSTIDNTVSYEEYKKLIDNSAIYYGFIIDAINQGQTFEDSSSYIVSKFLDELSNAVSSGSSTNSYVIVGEGVTCDDTSRCISESEFPSRAVEYANNTLTDSTLTDDLFTVVSKKVKDDTAGTLTYTTSMKVKDDGDFTVIKGSADSLTKTLDDLADSISSSIEKSNPTPITKEQVNVPDTGVSFPISVKILGIFALLFGVMSIIVVILSNKKQNQV